jgi:putative oxidoreductase
MTLLAGAALELNQRGTVPRWFAGRLDAPGREKSRLDKKDTVMRFIFPPFLGNTAAVGLLVLRLVAGSAFMLHGWPKIQHAFNWMPPEAPVPGALQALAALAEFGGGLCWILGLLTPLASFLIFCTMATAVGMVHLPHGDPFVAQGGPSFESALSYLSIAVMLLLAGPGKLSLDGLLFARKRNAGEPIA